MSDDALHRLEQAWKDARGDVRRAFLIAHYREQGATGESVIQIVGQVNDTELRASRGRLCHSGQAGGRHWLVKEAVTSRPCPVGPSHRSSLTFWIDTGARPM